MNSISEQREVLTHVTHVNGWNPDIYISRVVKTSVCFIVVLYATKSSYIVKVTVMTSPMDHPMSHRRLVEHRDNNYSLELLFSL